MAFAKGSEAANEQEAQARTEDMHQRKQQQRVAAAEAAQGGGDAARRAADAATKPAAGPLDILCRGVPGRVHGVLEALPNPLVLSHTHVAKLLGLSNTAEADTVRPVSEPPAPLTPLLPDLCSGNGGLHMTHTTAGAAKCALMAAVANRLAANGLQVRSACWGYITWPFAIRRVRA